MKLDRLQLFMVFMMKLLESMEMLILGNIVLRFLIIWEFPHLLKEKFSVSMQDYHQKLKR
jgi:hypothetical protein